MRARGFTMLELMIAIAIAGVLLALALNSFNTMLASSQSRTSAESLLSGLRMARSEAIKRNVPMRFQMMSSVDNTCDYSSSSPLWVVTQVDTATTSGLVRLKCGSGPYTPPDQPSICTPDVPPCSATVTTSCRGTPVASNSNPATCTEDPLIAFKSENAVPTGLTVSATGSGTAAYAVTFSPLGRIVANSEGSGSIDTINLTPTDSAAKAWRIAILSSSGTLKLCDPAAAASAPLSCP